MKKIYLNLKRFDIQPEKGGVNRIAPMQSWGNYIVSNVQNGLDTYKGKAQFAAYFPEAHIIPAVQAQKPDCMLEIGCQSVFNSDTAVGGNFGAFTTNRPANAMTGLGCTSTIIGHCEERRDKLAIMAEAGAADTAAVNRILNKEIKAAINAGMTVLYCIGETSEEQPKWQETLGRQLEIGLEGIDISKVTIAYEPVWAIGPGKTPPDRDYIQMIGKFVKGKTNGLDVVYGGGLKVDNAAMLASIPEIDGGLIALTRFSGEIGFYPQEYLEIIKTYMGF